MAGELKTMRDVFIERLYEHMHKDKNIFFLCADFGSPKLDLIRKKFSRRFINVGIAEQNLINVSAGLALEGYTVYAYAIAPFLTMRAYEQIRVNISLQAHLKEMNINLIGVGAGLSYDVSGPTHHCFEDISIMRTLPNISLISPSDWVLAERFVEYSIRVKKPKYFRFDGKPLAPVYKDARVIKLDDGFSEIKKGQDACLIATGFMTGKAIMAAQSFKGKNIGVFDIFMLKPFNELKFLKALKKYKYVITIEEGFINKGGLDSLISGAIENSGLNIKIKRMGFKDNYVFKVGSREYLHGLYNLDCPAIIKNIESFLREK